MTICSVQYILDKTIAAGAACCCSTFAWLAARDEDTWLLATDELWEPREIHEFAEKCSFTRNYLRQQKKLFRI